MSMNPYNKRTYTIFTCLILATLCLLPWAKLWPDSLVAEVLSSVLSSSSSTSLSMNGPWIYELVLMLIRLSAISSMGMVSILILIMTFLWVVPFLFTLITLIYTLMNDEERAFSLGTINFKIIYYYTMIYFGFILASQFTIDNLTSMLSMTEGLTSIATPGIGMYVMFFLAIFGRMLASPIYSRRQIYSIILSALFCFAMICPWIGMKFSASGLFSDGTSFGFSISFLQIVIVSFVMVLVSMIAVTGMAVSNELDALEGSGELAIVVLVMALLLFIAFWTLMTFNMLVRKNGKHQAAFLRTNAIMDLILSTIILIPTLIVAAASTTVSEMSVYPGFGLILTFVVSLVEMILLRVYAKRLMKGKSVPALFVGILDPNALVNVANLFGTSAAPQPAMVGQASVFGDASGETYPAETR